MSGMNGTGVLNGTDEREAARHQVRELEEQERRLVLDRFGNEDAWRLGCLLTDLARERGAAVTVDIRRGGQQLFHCALPGTSADNDAWIERKCRVVERYAESSYLVGARFRAKGRTFEESSRLDPDRYAAHGGAFPYGCAVRESSARSPSPASPGRRPRAGGRRPGTLHRAADGGLTAGQSERRRVRMISTSTTPLMTAATAAPMNNGSWNPLPLCAS